MPKLDLEILLEENTETKKARLEGLRATLEETQEVPAESEVQIYV